MSAPENQPRAGLPPRYTVLETIGSGGMGAVFRVQDHVRGETVALKLLRNHENEQQLGRFLREIESLRSLRHPGIVPFLDAGTLRSGRPFFTMPYFEGSRSLARWIEERRETGRLPPQPTEILALLWPLASALDHVHRLGLCHRDIKPGNILVTSGDSAVLLDFGLVGVLGAHATRLTSTGDVMGTLTYLSPEHARGREIQPASDVFQLGLVLHEMITGVRVIDEPIEFVRKVIGDEEPLPAERLRNPGFSPGLEAVLLRCLAPRPADRPASAGEVQAALENLPLDGWYAAHDAVTAGNPVWNEPEPPPSRALDALDLEDSLVDHLSEEFKQRYTLDRVLGRGGVGVVFAGRDRQLDRVVAVKFMRRLTRGETDEGAHRFAREAKLLARITHPNLVKVYDLHHEGDLAYFVSEYVEGEPLDRLLEREKPLALDRVRRIGLDVVGGLEALHREGILHRDIKPSNLMVTAGGIKILDLGIAQILNDATMGLTRTGQVIGTPLYCSPEQLQAGEVDATTDLYSLGLVLYEAISGKLPFPGSLYEVLARKVRGEMVPLEAPVPLPTHVQDLVESLLHFDAAARPRTATEVREKLERRWSDRPTDRTPVGGKPRGRTGKSPLPDPALPTRRRSAAVAILAVVAALAAAMIHTWWFASARFSPPESTSTLSGLTVRFTRDPAGPAELRVRWQDGRERVFPAPGAGKEHRITLDGLTAGDALELTPVHGAASGPPLSLQYRPVACDGLTVEHRPDQLVVTFVTGVAVTARLRARRAAGMEWLVEEKDPVTHHVLDLEARHMPFIPPLQVELGLAGETRDDRLELDETARARVLTFQAEWFEKSVQRFMEKFDRHNQEFSKQGGDFMLGPGMEKYRRSLIELDRELPDTWFLSALGGKDGILDHPLVTPTLKDRFHRVLFSLETWDQVRTSLAVPTRYPHPLLYGEYFGPAVATRYPSAHELPILLEGRSPGDVIFVAVDAPFRAHRENVARRPEAALNFEGHLSLGRLAPTARVELSVKARMPEGRQIHVLINDAYQVRLHPVERQSQAVTATWFAAFDPRYLKEGENRFVFSVPSLPILLENVNNDRFVGVQPPGFTLRLQED